MCTYNFYDINFFNSYILYLVRVLESDISITRVVYLAHLYQSLPGHVLPTEVLPISYSTPVINASLLCLPAVCSGGRARQTLMAS